MADASHAGEVGLLLPNGCRITHGRGANIKKPFPDMIPDLTMHELSAGNSSGFKGQLGLIQFDEDMRLPRHIHMDEDKTKLLTERIIVLNGVGMVELAGKVYVVAPGSLTDIKGGVPHTWTAAPEGVRLPNGTVSDGSFTMIYEYEETTSFFPTESTTPVVGVRGYRAYTGDLEKIRFPKLSAQQVVDTAELVLDNYLEDLSLA